MQKGLGTVTKERPTVNQNASCDARQKATKLFRKEKKKNKKTPDVLHSCDFTRNCSISDNEAMQSTKERFSPIHFCELLGIHPQDDLPAAVGGAADDDEGDLQENIVPSEKPFLGTTRAGEAGRGSSSTTPAAFFELTATPTG